MRKPGIYEHITNRYPKYPGDDPVRQEAITVLKQKVLNTAPTDDAGAPLTAYLNAIDEHVKEIFRTQIHATRGRRYASDFATMYVALRHARDSMAQWDHMIGLLLETYQQLMIDQFAAEGVRSVKLADGQGVSVRQEPFPQVTKANTEAFRLWCIEHGLQDKLTLHPSTMKKHILDMLLANEEPPDCVTVWTKDAVKLGVMPTPPKRYIGDGVYAEFNGFALVLTSEDGISILDRIVLEPEVYNALVNYVQQTPLAKEPTE